MSYKPKVKAVSEGGTNKNSISAYAILYSSATGVINELANGTTGQFLQANTGADPSWATVSSGGLGYMLNMLTTAGNPADGQTYYFDYARPITNQTTSGTGGSKLWIPKAGTITKCYGLCNTAGTLGSSENATIGLRLNNTSNTTVTSTLQLTSANVTFNNTALSITVAAGDYIEFFLTGPTWVTNPTTVRFTTEIYIT